MDSDENRSEWQFTQSSIYNASERTLIVAAVLLVATFIMRWRYSLIAWGIFGVMLAIGMVGIGGAPDSIRIPSTATARS